MRSYRPNSTIFRHTASAVYAEKILANHTDVIAAIRAGRRDQTTVRQIADITLEIRDTGPTVAFTIADLVSRQTIEASIFKNVHGRAQPLYASPSYNTIIGRYDDLWIYSLRYGDTVVHMYTADRDLIQMMDMVAAICPQIGGTRVGEMEKQVY